MTIEIVGGIIVVLFSLLFGFLVARMDKLEQAVSKNRDRFEEIQNTMTELKTLIAKSIVPRLNHLNGYNSDK